MSNVERGTPIYHLSDWGGGKFNVELSEDMDITLVRSDVAAAPIHAKIGKVMKVHGSDSDHGRVENWTFDDYSVVFPEDVIDRGTRLLWLLKSKTVRAYAGTLHRAEILQFHPDAEYYKGDVIPPSYIANNLGSMLHHLDELHYQTKRWMRKHEGAEIVLRHGDYVAHGPVAIKVVALDGEQTIGVLTQLVDPPKLAAWS